MECKICGTECFRPGKFEGNSCQTRAEAIWEISAQGCDDETGDVSEVGVWFGLLNDLSDCENDVFGAKAAVVSEDDQGFVIVAVFGSSSEAVKAFEESEEDVSALYEGDSDIDQNDVKLERLHDSDSAYDEQYESRHEDREGLSNLETE